MTHKEKLKKLQVYLEKCKRDASDTTRTRKKPFFEQEILRTAKAIEKISK